MIWNRLVPVLNVTERAVAEKAADAFFDERVFNNFEEVAH